MRPHTSELSKGLRFILGGVAANLLALFLPGGVSLAAAGMSFTLTALGLLFAARADKRYWIPMVLLTVNTFLMGWLYDWAVGELQLLLVGLLETVLSVSVICLICMLTLPFLRGGQDSGAQEGQLAWKCEVASAVITLSDDLMRNVPEREGLKLTLNLMASLGVIAAAVLYLVFLWKASSALEAKL